MNGNKVIQFILKNECLKAATFARSINITPTQVYDLRDGKIKGVSSEIADKILEVYPHYSKTWLMTGLGEEFESSEVLSTAKDEIQSEASKRWDEVLGNAMASDDSLTLAEAKQEIAYWRNKAQDLEYKLAKMGMA